ncbi:MAG: hypothetical protein NT001_01270, partial [Candidatus Woesearchaeota archaeon]|nr:hypothetical protein [Candidatus Woesearchaeota archaeon]
GANTLLCVNEEGNFYEEHLTPAAGDCGPSNFTFPLDHEKLAAAMNVVRWKNQSSFRPINYSLYYSNNTGMTWHLLTATAGSSYNWSTRTMNESSDYRFRIIPYDGIYNGTDYEVPFTLDMNEWVCSNDTECEYPNITSALYHENNTNSTITLMDSSTYTLSGTGTYNISPAENYAAIRINAESAKLDCNYGKITGSSAGYGVLIDGYNHAHITKCYIYNYSYGIAVNNSDSSCVQYNFMDNNAVSDLDLASSSNNSKISHNSFYSNGVNDAGTSNSFCVWDYLFGIPIAAHGNLYEERINRSYIEDIL